MPPAWACGMCPMKSDHSSPLIDGPAFTQVWEERRPLLLGQIHKADLVAVSRADLVPEDEYYKILDALDGVSNSILGLSAEKGQGLEEVMQILA